MKKAGLSLRRWLGSGSDSHSQMISTLWSDHLQARLVEKHGRDSDEGRSLRALREIRIQATPSWSAENINLMIWFIPYAENAGGTSLPTHTQLESWLKLIKPSGRFRRVHGQIETLERLRAVDYLASDLLDLDHLSSG